MLVLSVVEFHRRLRGIASVAVQVHGELAVEDRQLRVLVEGQIVFVQLVAGGTDNLYGAVAADAFLNGANRGDVGRAADVACAVVTVDLVKGTLSDFTHELFILRQVLVIPAFAIAKAVSHHDAAAVDALPQADGEGIAFVAFIERLAAPTELLRRKADESAM